MSWFSSQPNTTPVDFTTHLQPEDLISSLALEWKPADAHTRCGLNTAAASYFQLSGCWWTSWADCPLLDMSLGEVTRWPQGPSGTSPLRNNSALTSGNLPLSANVREVMFSRPPVCMFSCFSSSPAPCVNTALQLWKYSAADRGMSCAI